MLKFFENKLLQTPCGAVWRPETMTSAVIVHQFELVDMPPFSFFTFYAFHRILSLFIPLFPLYYFIALFSSLFLFFPLFSSNKLKWISLTTRVRLPSSINGYAIIYVFLLQIDNSVKLSTWRPGYVYHSSISGYATIYLFLLQIDTSVDISTWRNEQSSNSISRHTTIWVKKLLSHFVTLFSH